MILFKVADVQALLLQNFGRNFGKVPKVFMKTSFLCIIGYKHVSVQEYHTFCTHHLYLVTSIFLYMPTGTFCTLIIYFVSRHVSVHA